MTPARDFHIVLVNKWFAAGNPFSEIVDTLTWGLRELGHRATSAVNHWRSDAHQIVLCPHLLADATLLSLPPNTVAYNFEQIAPATQLPPERLRAFRNVRVWDYSRRNIERWREADIEAAHVPVGHYPGLARIEPAAEEDIDVLFFGILNDRRRTALDRIAAQGLRVVVAHMAFGRQRDELIARAKTIANIHFYPGIFETVRASYLLANGKTIVSERDDDEIPAEYETAVLWSAYEDLPIRCREAVDDAALRARLGDAGRAAMSGIPIAPLLREALGGKPADDLAY